jgi:beta-phosphoglucomutase-like phosphatase (HAD superfamily)
MLYLTTGGHNRLKKTKVVIYDCDGVLFDSKASNEAFYNHILEHFGMPPLQPEQLDFVHVSTAEEAIDFLFQSSPSLAEAQAYRKTMDYRPFVPLMRMEPYLLEVLRRLRQMRSI